LNYTLDTNILIGLRQRYPRDLFPSLWQALEATVDAGRVCICAAVLDELSRGTDDLHAWAGKYVGLVCPASQDDVDLAAAISIRHPEWVREQRNAADPFVVAHARNESRAIVTEERAAGPGVTPRRQKVPNVANEYGVSSVGFLDWVRAEGWRF
jgi:hypothetical protein